MLLMFMDAEGCLVTAKSEQAIDKIISLWEYEYEKDNACCFEDYPSDVFEVMEKVVKTVHHMEATGEKEEFSISGKIMSDWDCTIFTIVYDGNEPLIKSSQAEPDSDSEELFYIFNKAEYDEIPDLLEAEKDRNFEQAIKDDIPLGGYLEMSYEEWVATILG